MVAAIRTNFITARLPHSEHLENVLSRARSLAGQESASTVSLGHTVRAINGFRLTGHTGPVILRRHFERREIPDQKLDFLRRPSPQKGSGTPENGSLLNWVLERANQIALGLNKTEVGSGETLCALLELIHSSIDFDALPKEQREQALATLSKVIGLSEETTKANNIVLNRELEPLKILLGDLPLEFVREYLSDPEMAEQKLASGGYQIKTYKPGSAELDLTKAFPPIEVDKVEVVIGESGKIEIVHKKELLPIVIKGEEVKKQVLAALEQLDPLRSEEAKKLGLTILSLIDENDFKSHITKEVFPDEVIKELTSLKSTMETESFDRHELESQINTLKKIVESILYEEAVRSKICKSLKKQLLRNKTSEAVLSPLIEILTRYQGGAKFLLSLTRESRFDVGGGD